MVFGLSLSRLRRLFSWQNLRNRRNEEVKRKVTWDGGPFTPGPAPAPTVKRTLQRSLTFGVRRSNTTRNRQDDTVLTESRRLAIRDSWKVIRLKYESKMPELGVAMYQQVFRSFPQLKQVFKVQDVPSEKLIEVPSFARHARVFANLLDLTVRNVMELETEIAPILIMYGRRHHDKHQLGFQHEYLSVFAQGLFNFFMDETKEMEDFVEVTKAWKLVVAFMIQKIKEGYDAQLWSHKKNNKKGINAFF